jgi:hypothetical protein
VVTCDVMRKSDRGRRARKAEGGTPRYNICVVSGSGGGRTRGVQERANRLPCRASYVSKISESEEAPRAPLGMNLVSILEITRH